MKGPLVRQANSHHHQNRTLAISIALLVGLLSPALHADPGPREARKVYATAKKEAESLYKNSAKSSQRHYYTKLIKRFDKLEKQNKNNDLAYRSCFMAASVAEQLSLASRVPSDLDEAMQRMLVMAQRYPKSRMADDALLAAALMALQRRGDKKKARELLHKLLDLGHGDMRPQARELLARLPKAEPKAEPKTEPKAKPKKTRTASVKAKSQDAKQATKQTTQQATKQTKTTKKTSAAQEPTDRIAELLHKAELIRTKASTEGGSDASDKKTVQTATKPAYQPRPRKALPKATKKRLARIKRLSSKKLKNGLELRVHIDREVESHRGDVPAQADKNIPHRAFVDLDLCKVARGLRAIRPRNSTLLRQVRVGQNTETRARIVFELIDDSELSGPWPCPGGLCFFISDPKSITSPPSPQLLIAKKDPVKDKQESANSKTAHPDKTETAHNKSKTENANANANANTNTNKDKVKVKTSNKQPKLAGADVSLLPSKSSSAGLSLSQQVGLQIKTIVIDAGHGGRDPGAIGPTGLREKNVTLKIAKNLAARLRKELGVKVIMTRSKDVYVSLEERARIANDAHADLFISIHINASTNRRAYGMETFYLNTTNDRYAIRLAARENADSQKSIGDLQFILADLVTKSNVDDSRRLAKAVQRSAKAELIKKYSRIKDLGTKSALFYVLIGVRMPSILFEAAFVSNRREEKRLRNKKYLDHLARGMANGVVNFVRKQNKGTASRS